MQTHKIVYDLVEMKPACVLLQALYGGDSHLPNLFPPGSWLLQPTPDMQGFNVTDKQLEQLIAATEAAMKPKRAPRKIRK
jgi:hypothetical protein